MSLTFHILCNPYVPSLATNTADAFTQFARRFSKMMTKRGHTTLFYGSGWDNSLVCSEYISCLDMKAYHQVYNKGFDYNSAKLLVTSDWDDDMKEKGNTILSWYLEDVTKYLKEKGNPEKDLIMHFYNWATYCGLKDSFKDWKHIDGMIMSNYGCCPYRFYCSNMSQSFELVKSWGEIDCAKRFGITEKTNSQLYPTLKSQVIYPFFNPYDFTYEPKKKTGAILYLARVQKYKGIDIFMALSKQFPDKEFWICGNPHPSESGFNLDDYPNVKYWGFASIKLRRKLLSEASCLIQASSYDEPFGWNICEAYLSGTMVITSDRGAFRETVLQGITGFRCNNMNNYIAAIKRIGEIKPANCREWASKNFTEEKAYQGYMSAFRCWFPTITQWNGDEHLDDLDSLKMIYPH